jgi:lipoprotein NlpI
MPGDGNFVIPPPDEPGASYTLTSTFNIGPVPDILSGRRFEMPGPLPVTSMPGDFLMGPLFNTKIKDGDPTPCYSGRQEEDVTLTAPKGRRFLTPPPDEDIRTANLVYTTHWSVSQDTLTLHREFTSHIDTALCDGRVRKETAEKLLAIRKSYLYGGALSPELTEEQTQLMSKLQAARDADKRGDRDAALKDYSEVIAEGRAPADTPAIVVARVGRAAIYIHQQKFDEAIDEYSEAVKLNPQLGRIFPTLAQNLTDRRDFVRAERIWTIAITGNANSADLYDRRGVVRDDLGRHGDAQGDFAKAIAIGGTPQTVARVYADRGSSHWSAREPAAAIKDYDEAIKRDATVAGTFEGRGLVEWTNGALAAAHADFEKAATLDPKDMYYALWLFIVDARMGKDAKAALRTRSEGWDTSSWPGPLIKAARGDLAADAIEMPTHAEAFQRARDLCEKDFYLAELALAGGDRDKALALFRDTVSTGITEYLEYAAAGFEIDRLSGKS